MVGMWITIAIVVIVLLWLILSYNAFVRLRNQVQNSWAQIDVQLKRRNDLIPNLINTVKGYAKHERETLESVTNARTQMMSAQKAGTTGDVAQADNMLAGALKSLFAVAESYPDLKANSNFLQLQEELSGTENKVAASRQYFNDRVMQYNTKRESFPANLIAGIFNFGPKELYEIPEEEKAVPKVEF
ncbi:MAG: LemA family protein [Nanoarchaeota archaeon]|nr:LemA family protein [Nanoarchaeota archaeon]